MSVRPPYRPRTRDRRVGVTVLVVAVAIDSGTLAVSVGLVLGGETPFAVYWV